MPEVLSACDLVKQYPKVRAVDGVSFAVEAGSCFGLLGPNGAGKSTTVEMLEGLVTPTAGEIRFHGAPRGRDYRARIGIQFQATALQDHLRVIEHLRFFAALYPRRADLDEIIHTCRLEEFLDRDARKLSGGQRQRLLLGIALVNDPELLFLDEPTTGLDPQARRNFWDLVTAIRAQRKTIVLTTHYMEEAYRLCDRVAIVDRGRIIAAGSPQALLAQHFRESVIELPAEHLAEAPAGLEFKRNGAVAELVTASVEASLRQLLDAGVPLAELRVRAPTLEDLFLELTGRELRA
jgi:ABC-type multidrug transport system, ATPase component